MITGALAVIVVILLAVLAVSVWLWRGAAMVIAQQAEALTACQDQLTLAQEANAKLRATLTRVSNS
jgi:hypothetical protein